MTLSFKNFDMEDTLYNMVSDYCKVMAIEKPINDFTKEEMNELLEDVFSHYKPPMPVSIKIILIKLLKK